MTTSVGSHRSKVCVGGGTGTGSAVHAPQGIVEQSAGYPAWDGEASPRSRVLFWDTIAAFFITLGERSALMTNSSDHIPST